MAQPEFPNLIPNVSPYEYGPFRPQLQACIDAINGGVGANPGGTNGQIQYNNGGTFGGFTMGGDLAVVTSTGLSTIAAGAVSTGKIAASAVTLAKIQNAGANSRWLGSGAAGVGAAYTENTFGTGLSVVGTALNLADTAVTPGIYGDATHVAQVTIDQQGRVTLAANVAISGGGSGITQLTGDVTAGPGSGSQAATIANNAVTSAKINNSAVTLAKIQNAAANSVLLGAASGGAGAAYTENTLGNGLTMVGTVLTPTFIGARAYNNGSQNIANNGQVALLDSEEYDTSNIHSTVTNTSRMTIPAGMGGYWRFEYNTGQFAANATQTREVGLQVNGVGNSTIGTLVSEAGTIVGGANQLMGCATLKLNAGDYVEMFIFQNSGGALAVGNAAALQSTSFAAQFMGA